MMGQPQPPDASYQQIAQRLGNYGIKRIAIIDDAYDLPVRSDFAGSDALEQFFAEVDSDAEARAELETIDVKLNDANDLTDEILRVLFDKRQSLVASRRYCDRLFRLVEEKLSELKPLYDSLKGDLGLEVDRFGAKDELTDLTTKVIFIDYYLGLGQDAHEVAKSIARQTYGKYENEPSKPLIILMTSREISEEMIAAFRDESGLLGGTFYFVHKKDFSNKDKLHLKIGAWAMAMPYSEKIQTFVNTLQRVINNVADQFIRDIRKLSVDDYGYIQKLSLHEDGQPLGDYMLWLYSAYFGKILFEAPDVREQQEVIDAMAFDDLPPSQIKPSLQLAEIYKSALFATVEDVGIHPHDEKDSQIMYLHLGDLFMKDGDSEVWMVLNAQCDLEFAPDAVRKPKPERSILMISGRLRLLSDALDDIARRLPRTELFEHGGTAYRILWNTKKIHSPSHGEFKEWKEKFEYKRIAQLRLPYALEVQRAFAADLTRVGMPVAPPIYLPITLQLLCMNGTGRIEVLQETSGGAHLFLTRDSQLCLLTEDFVSQIKIKITNAKEGLNQRISELESREGAEKSVAKLREWIATLEKLETDYDALLDLRVPFAIPEAEESTQIKSSPLCISRKAGLKAGATYRSDQPLTLFPVF
jgi:hypothetical protein